MQTVLLAHRSEARIAHARQLLRYGLSAKETAAECGFSSANHLCRIFRARTGTRPAMFARGVGN
ncbi:MAG: helix-turn-helix domain-containing protein [Planctomycetota bacterium]